eukprot:1917758-Rhodomonas_salina.1
MEAGREHDYHWHQLHCWDDHRSQTGRDCHSPGTEAQWHLESLPEEELMPGTKEFKTDTNTHLETVTEEDGDIDNNP